MTHPSTWTSAVMQTMTTWEVAPFATEVTANDRSSKEQRKRVLKEYRKTQVEPKANQFDKLTWWPKQTNFSCAPGWTVSAAAETGASLRNLQAWAQLRLQGKFTRVRSSIGAANCNSCRLCADGVPETAHHLLLHCPGTEAEEVRTKQVTTLPFGREAGAAWLSQSLGACPPSDLVHYVHMVGNTQRQAEARELAG